MKHVGLRLTTTIPDDGVYPDDGEEVYGGKAVGDVIAEHLRKLGYQVDDGYSLDSAGWEYPFSTKNRLFSYRSQHMGDWVIFGFHEDTDPISRFFFKKAVSLDQVLQGLSSQLHADSRFTKVEWFEDPGVAFLEEVEGAPEPAF